jgi:hypothetical protein
MAPSATSVETPEVPLRAKGATKIGLELTGSLDGFPHFDVTPAIGREFAATNIVDDILNQPNADELLRDLAITSESDAEL